MGNIIDNKGFRAFGILTVVAVYFLILVGGIVRSTGSGMGCPDWPKCFGHIIPPTSVEDLPDNYKEIFVTKRFEKNRRVASVFSSLGFTTLAEKLVNDKSIYAEVDFDPITTWIEYINRLVGVTIGLPI
jgi:cytochrome c oxidase assembly protein subunit 15